MSPPVVIPSIRVRRTPFSNRVEAAGPKACTVYNHMILASWYRSLEEDYAHLKSAVQLWDVSCERQVEVSGPDAAQLVQMTTPRDISRMADDQCYYIPSVDDQGHMLNDPVLLKLDENRFWVSLADSDMLLYFKGLAATLKLDVTVFEPDVSPLAVQGPKADQLIARVFGDDIVATRFFRHQPVDVKGRRMVIARSGWSLQGGFEIYLDGSDLGEHLWDMLFEAGRDLDVRVGCPNNIERIEGGLLSYGSDMTRDHTPLEAGLGKYCNLDSATGCLGHQALLQKKEPARQIRPVEIEGAALPGITARWPLLAANGDPAGSISSHAFSPDFKTNVAIAMVDRPHWHAGTALVAETPVGKRAVRVRETFWI